MFTYQDYLEAVAKGEELDFIRKAIDEYKSSPDYKIALDADDYEAERNVTIMSFMRTLFTTSGKKVPDFTASNNKIASNFFHRLTTQRVSYSLGNGVSFPGAKVVIKDGKAVLDDETKKKLGKDFDTVLYRAAKAALIHKVAFLFWNLDHADYFKMTEFLPLFDEETGALRMGLRFWSLDWNNRPVTVVKYEEDGYTKYKTKRGSKGLDLVLWEEKKGYVQHIAHTDADGDRLIGESNYSALPIVPLWGNEHHQSDLVGMRSKIDSFDLIKSGFVNDLEECSEIYWLITNSGGMQDEDLARFRDRLKFNHIAVVDSNTPVKAETHDIPVEARKELLKGLREQIYEDYGGLDVHTVAAGATNDHIDAAYQPVDDEADDFEYQIIEMIKQLFKVIGLDEAVPSFKRNKISNWKEQTDMVLNSADHLDEETTLNKLPFITPDEVPVILARKTMQIASTFTEEEEV